MHLSDSEAFWLATIYESFWDLVRLELPFGEPRELPIASEEVGHDAGPVSLPVWRAVPVTTTDANALSEIEFGHEIYSLIQQSAIAYGLAGTLDWQRPSARTPVVPPKDIRWGGFGGEHWTADECESLCVVLRTCVEEARDSLMQQTEAGAGSSAFESALHSAEVCSLIGYAPSTPRTLYYVGADGLVYVKAEIPPRARGLYAALMELFKTCVPLPCEERMAMAGINATYAEPLETWIPTTYSLDRPYGDGDSAAAAALLEEFRQANANSEAWQLGRGLAHLQRWMAERSQSSLALASTTEECNRSVEKRQTQPSVESDENEASLSQEESEQEDTDGGSFFLTIVKRICERAATIEDEYRNQPPEEAFHDEDGRRALASEIMEFLRTANAVIELSHKEGLASVVEIVSSAKASLPPPEMVIQGQWQEPVDPAGLRKQASRYGQMARLLDHAAKVAYGELRLRDLRWDEHGLTPQALTGWAGQRDNIREAIKVAIDQMNNGLKPYVVLSQLAPAVQSLICELSAKHLRHYAGLTPGGLLKALQDKVRDSNDEDLRVAVRVADALNTLRNRVVHKDSIKWERDHAAFFLYGISILLRSV